jgi:hypothetical protein
LYPEWIGHVLRVDGNKDRKDVTTGNPGRRRKNEHWVSNVESGLRNMGVKRWRTRTLDRT